MFALANLIIAFAKILDVVLVALWWLILARAVISWVSPDPFNPIVQFLYKLTEPILQPVRKLLAPSFRFGIDVSPIIVFLVILFLRYFLIATLFELAQKLKFAY